MKRITILLFITLFFYSHINAQWQQTNGPFGGSVNCIAVIGTHVFAGTYNGVYISSNNGTNWVLTNTGLTQTWVLDLAVLGTQLFAATYGVGIIVSSNNGQSWTPANNGLPNNAKVRTLYIDGNDIYAGIDSHGVFKSANNGLNWIEVGAGSLTNFPVRSITSLGSNIFAATSTGIFHFNYNTSNWELLTDSNIVSRSIFSLVKVGTHIFAGHEWGLVFMSADTGNTWSIVNNGLNTGAIYSLKADGSVLYAGTYNGVHKTSNYGASWTALNSGMLQHHIFDIYISGNTILAAGNMGINKSTDSGINWTAINTGIKNFHVSKVAATDTHIYAGGYENGLFLSTDSGTTWSGILNGMNEYEMVRAIAVKNNHVYVYINGHGFKISSDYGSNWTSVNLTGNINDIVFIGGDVVAAGNKIYKSSDNGLTWDTLNTGINTSIFTSLATDGANIFAGTYMGEILLSTDSGTSWTSINNGLPQGMSNMAEIASIAIHDSLVFVALKWLGVYVSEYYGNNWHPVNAGLPSTYFNSLFASGTNLYVGTDAGLFVSTNNGALWNNVSTGLTDLNIRCMAESGSSFYVGTAQSSVWKRSLSDFNFYNFSGNVFNDLNNNGIRDISEPGIPDVLLNTLSDNWMHNTDTLGKYNAYSTSIIDSIIIINPSLYATVTPLGYAVNNQDTGKNFAVHFLPNINDLKVTVTNLTAARPGFDDVIKITYKNVGTTTLSGNVTLDFDNNNLSFISSSPTQTSINANTINWNFTNLQPLEQRDITVQFNVFPTVPIGTVLSFTGIIYPIIGDSAQTNNTNSITQIVNGSYDPNEKEVVPWYGMTPQQLVNGEELTYTIHFQNTGTDTAFTVVIIDTLTSGLDVTTFQILSSSHPCTFNIRDLGIVDFYFNNILLPDSNVNFIGSNGFVKYSIKPKAGLQLGDNITNTAYIYFDYNLPVATNTTNTLIATGITENVPKENTINIYPNPANDKITIETTTQYKDAIISVFNIQGQLLLQLPMQQLKTEMNISKLTKGVYALKIENAEYLMMKKFIKY